ncbi:MAG: hypothetical protein M1570_07580 [Chloroflexi bacterium]|nr:hypothetical protein [Chloroflexota bacterium]
MDLLAQLSVGDIIAQKLLADKAKTIRAVEWSDLTCRELAYIISQVCLVFLRQVKVHEAALRERQLPGLIPLKDGSLHSSAAGETARLEAGRTLPFGSYRKILPSFFRRSWFETYQNRQ